MSKSAVSKIKTNDSGSGDEDMPVCVVAVCCSVLQCVAVCCSVLQCVAVCCCVLLCVVLCCSALQRGMPARRYGDNIHKNKYIYTCIRTDVYIHTHKCICYTCIRTLCIHACIRTVCILTYACTDNACVDIYKPTDIHSLRIVHIHCRNSAYVRVDFK